MNTSISMPNGSKALEILKILARKSFREIASYNDNPNLLNVEFIMNAIRSETGIQVMPVHVNMIAKVQRKSSNESLRWLYDYGKEIANIQDFNNKNEMIEYIQKYEIAEYKPYQEKIKEYALKM